MTKKLATKDQALECISVAFRGFNDMSTVQLQHILDDVYPYSWSRYCERKGIQKKIKKEY